MAMTRVLLFAPPRGCGGCAYSPLRPFLFPV
jgi:hypothetical protein